MSVCPHCGTKYPGHGRRCTLCGAPIRNESAPAERPLREDRDKAIYEVYVRPWVDALRGHEETLKRLQRAGDATAPAAATRKGRRWWGAELPTVWLWRIAGAIVFLGLPLAIAGWAIQLDQLASRLVPVGHSPPLTEQMELLGNIIAAHRAIDNLFALWLVGVACAFCARWLGTRKGYDRWGSFGGGMVGGPIALIVLALLPDLTRSRRCPYCQEGILEDATICRWCGRDLPPEEQGTDAREPAPSPPGQA